MLSPSRAFPTASACNPKGIQLFSNCLLYSVPDLDFWLANSMMEISGSRALNQDFFFLFPRSLLTSLLSSKQGVLWLGPVLFQGNIITHGLLRNQNPFRIQNYIFSLILRPLERAQATDPQSESIPLENTSSEPCLLQGEK